jgi:bla regulator protein BlaR1
MRDRLSAKWQYALWLLFVGHLLLPVGFESMLSVYNIFPSLKEQAAFSQPFEILPAVGNIAGATNDPTPVVHKLVFPGWQNLLSIIWIIGVVIMLGHAIVVNLKLWRQFRNLSSVSEPRLLNLLQSCKKRMHISKKIELCQSSAIRIPMLYGFLHPSIILPATQVNRLTTNQLQHIFCHELAHYKRNDILFSHVATALQILHWFNPFIWLAFQKIRFDREVACDSIALNHLGREQSRTYGTTILSILENLKSESLLPLTIGIVESKKNLKKRLVLLKKFRKPSLVWTLVTVILISVIAVTVMTEAKYKTTAESNDREAAAIVENSKIKTPSENSAQPPSISRRINPRIRLSMTLVPVPVLCGIQIMSRF